MRRVVAAKLVQLDHPCLTAGCEHGPRYANVCEGYFVHGKFVDAEGGTLHESASILRPFVQPFFCEIFPQLEDPEKTACRECRAKGFSLRVDFDGVYCHGCGLFVDFKSRQLGYVEEWTTRIDRDLSSSVKSSKCENCGSTVIAAKFGEYGFCSKQCLRNWYTRGVQPSTEELGKPSTSDA